MEVLNPGTGDTPVFSYTADTFDPIMKRIPAAILSKKQSDAEEFLRLLAGFITEKASSDYDKVKKAHDWVALNIKYDTVSYFSGRTSAQDVNAVVKRGTAVCAGYADVFKTLCDALEIECEVVTGYARGYTSGLFRYEYPASPNHAWNIVKIEGREYLIDCTWDAGHLNGRNFQARYRTAYFFIDPGVFIYDHFPDYSRNQLLDKPVSAGAFVNLPLLRPLFFEAFETWPDLVKITEISFVEDVILEFTLKPGYELSYAWLDEKEKEIGRTVHPSKRDVYHISLPKQGPGKYKLELYARKTGERTGWICAEFGFSVNA